MDAPPVKYVKTSDGYNIACCSAGSGLPVVVTPFARGHVQLNWRNDLVVTRRAPFITKLAEQFRVITFDDRGQGLSTRGLPQTLALSDFDLDLEAVTAEIEEERFSLVGCARAGHIAARYAIRHPERVSALVLVSCPVSFERSVRPDTWSVGLFDLLPSENWDFFLQTQVLPGLPPEKVRRAVAMLKETVTQKDYETAWNVWRTSDIAKDLPLIRVPTLVLHPRDFSLLAAEESSRMAASIHGASISVIDGSDFFGDAAQAVEAIAAFLSGLETSTPQSALGLSKREIEVLRLIASGYSNLEIAGALVLSVRTVERHIANLYLKTGTRTTAQATAYAIRHNIE
jgi:pimeloyl-ACP methyl ester carboxylesterase/DNA-binding CsgD family transcriptional regulator